MQKNIEIIRELYNAAEGKTLNLNRFISLFSDNAYVLNVPAEMEFHGKDIAMVASGMAAAFSDIHREIFSMYVMSDVVVAELAIRGTHTGELITSEGTLAPTGKIIDVPCCDIFHIENGKIVSFHCYNALSIMQRQLS